MTATPIKFIDLGAQSERIRSKVDAAVAAVMDHGAFIMGPEVKNLEERLADYCGVKHAISCSSGTDALLLPLMAKGVGPGDAVIVPTFTFAATAEVVALLGAAPVFADVDRRSFNLDLASVERAFDVAVSRGLNPVGLIGVDLFGQMPDYDALRLFASEKDIWLIADAAQSFGSTIDGRRAGQFGDATATSFFPAKPLGCYGDGGAIFTDDDELATVIRSLRVHGQGADKYDNVRIGTNARLDTIQAAILLEKLSIFDDELERRQAVADRYDQGLRHLVEVPTLVEGRTSAWAQYTIKLEQRDAAAASLKELGVPTNVYYPNPLHTLTAFRNFPRAADHLEMAEELSQIVLSLPMHPYLEVADQERIIDAVSQVLESR